MMELAHRKADSHAILFRRIESVEELVCGIRSETDPRVCHAETHVVILIRFGFDQQLSRPVVNAGHRVRSIAYQVQHDLLQLDAIADDGRKVLGELAAQDHAIPLQVAQRQCNHLARGLVQIQRLLREFLVRTACAGG